MSVRGTLILLTLITLGIPFALLSSQRSSAANARGVGDLENAQLYQVERENVTRHVEAVGEVEADEIVQLVFEAGGRIAEVYVREGDYVTQGSVLARLENDHQMLAYQQAALELNQRELEKYDLMEISEDDLRVAEAQLRAAWTQLGNAANSIRDEDIAALETQAAESQREYEYLLAQRDQAPGGWNGDGYQQLDARAGQASFQAELARLQADLLRQQREPAQNIAYAQVLNAQSQLEVILAGPTDAQIRQADIEIAQAQSQLVRAETNYNETFLLAPFDGIISRLDIEDGALVVADSSIAEMTDISPLTLNIEVDEVDIGLIESGMTVLVELDALPGVELEAIIEEIAPRGEDNSGIVTYDVDVNLIEDNPMVRVGMTADTTIVIEQESDSLSVPNPYITRDTETGQPYVTVLRDDGRLEEVSVTLGLAGTDNTAVVSGLEEGDLIVLQRSTDGGFFGG